MKSHGRKRNDAPATVCFTHRRLAFRRLAIKSRRDEDEFLDIIDEIIGNAQPLLRMKSGDQYPPPGLLFREYNLMPAITLDRQLLARIFYRGFQLVAS